MVSNISIVRSVDDIIKPPKEDRSVGLGKKLNSELFLAHAHTMPSSVVSDQLLEFKKHKGLTKTLKQLDKICKKKEKRYITVSPFPPKRKKNQFLHIIKASNPSPQPMTCIGDSGNDQEVKPSGLLNMMEPSLAVSENFGGKTYSNAELLILDRDKLEALLSKAQDLTDVDVSRIRDKKSKLDDFYKSKVYFIVDGKIVTKPTTPYADRQFIVISSSDRKDLLEVAQSQKSPSRYMSGIRGRSQSISTFSSETFNTDSVVKEVRKSIDPSKVVNNSSSIESVAHLVNDLDQNCMVGQSSPDIASDPHYQHLHVFLDVAKTQIPGFSSPFARLLKKRYKDKQGQNQTVTAGKLSSKAFNHSSVYRITATSIDSKLISFLNQIQESFLKNENNESSSLCLVGRKTENCFEFYFILKKNAAAYPNVKQAVLSTGSSLPGWAEMMGIRIGSSEVLNKFSDDQYKEKVLKPFDVSYEECDRFEKIIESQAQLM